MYFRNDNQDPNQNLNEAVNENLDYTRDGCGCYHEKMHCPMIHWCKMMHEQGMMYGTMMPHHMMQGQMMPTEEMRDDDPDDPRVYRPFFHHYHPFYHPYYHPYFHHRPRPWWMHY